MKKYILLLIVFLTIQAYGQKGVIIPTKPNPQPVQSKTKLSNSNSNSTSTGAEIWRIDAATVACNSGQCMLVKKQGQQDFEIFEDKIEGFDYTEGESYTLQVKKSLKSPPIKANESIYKYELVKINSTSDPKYQNTKPGDQSYYGNIINIDIDYGTISCESGSEKQCYLVREKNQKDYEIFNGCIYGFTFEGGYRYTLQVKRNGLDYDLVKIVKKDFVEFNPNKIACTNQRTGVLNYDNTTNLKPEPRTSINTSSALDKKWYLRKMKDETNNNQSLITDDNVIWIEINSFNDKLKGFGSCNSFEAVVRSDLNTSFQVSKVTSTLKNCGYIKLESLFLKVLQDADRFEIRDGNLILSKQWKYLMEFTSNPNQKEETKTSQNYQPKNTTIQNESSNYNSSPPSNNNITVSSNSSKEMEDLQKELLELKQQLAAKQEREAEAIKKLEQEKLQQQKEAELLKQQLAEKEKQKLEEAQRLKLEQEKQKALKEIEEMKKQLAEKEKNLNTNTIQNNNNTSTNNSKTATNSIEENIESKSIQKDISSNYIITEFKPNASNDIPEPDFTLRPYYLNGNKLERLERTEGIFVTKQKGFYRGTERFVNAMKPESEIQFKKGNLPRFFIKLENEKADPYDLINLCIGDVKKDRRIFIFRSQKMTGKVRDVTDNFIDLEFKKIRDGLYEIIIDEELDVGEYGFLPIPTEAQSASFVNSVKINCFGVAP